MRTRGRIRLRLGGIGASLLLGGLCAAQDAPGGKPAAPAPSEPAFWAAPADLGGAPGEGETKPSYETCSGRAAPAAALRGSGALAAAWWAAEAGGKLSLYWSERPPGSRDWTPARKVNDALVEPDDPAGFVRLAALPDGSLLLLVLVRKGEEGPLHLLASTLPASGRSWTAPASVNDAFGPDVQVAGLPGGGLAAVWARDPGQVRGSGTPRATRRTAAGGSWGPAEPLRTGRPATYTGSGTGRRGPRPTVTAGGGAPLVAASPDGALTAVWLDDVVKAGELAGRRVLSRRLEPGRRAWSPPVPVGIEDALLAPGGLASVGAALHLVALDARSHVVWSVRPAGTAPWSAPVLVSSEASTTDEADFKVDDLRLTAKPDGTLLATWRRARDEGDASLVSIEAARLAPGAAAWERLPSATRTASTDQHHGSGFTGEGRPFVVLDSYESNCQRALLVEGR